MILKENKTAHAILPAMCLIILCTTILTPRIIYSMHNHLCVSANVCTNMLLIIILWTQHSSYLHQLYCLCTYVLLGSIPVLFQYKKLQAQYESNTHVFTFSCSRVILEQTHSSLLRHKENAHWNLSKIIRIVSDLNSRWCPVKGGRELWLCFQDSYSCFASYSLKCIVYFYTAVDFS